MNAPITNTDSVHQKYFDYIYNKRVIFVGPAPNMIGRGLGEWIDSFDVVVRTNHFPVLMGEDKSLAVDYGTKCHVLYTNMQYYHKGMRPFRVDLYKQIGIKWFCMKRCKDVDYRLYHRDFKIRVIQKSVKYMTKIIKSPLMGNIICYDLSECIPGELAVAGIDFYQSSGKDYAAYVPNYIPKEIQKVNAELKIGQGVGHDERENTQYMADMYDRGMITMPDFIVEKMREVLK